MSGIDTVLTVLYEIKARPDRLPMLRVKFYSALGGLESYYQTHRLTLENFFEQMEEAHGSRHQLNLIAEALEDWQRRHFPAY